MTSKPFKRKLKNTKFGFRYFRIWGHPLKPNQVAYHLATYSNNPNFSIFEHPEFGWLTLYVSEERLTYPGHRKYKTLAGSLDNRYFAKRTQALKVLHDYTSGRTTKGLYQLCDRYERNRRFTFPLWS